MPSIHSLFHEKDYAPLLRFWNRLSDSEKEHLFSQIKQINPHLLKIQKQLLSHPPLIDEHIFEPFLEFAHSGNQQDELTGKKQIAEGRVGCLLLAGGQGSRLRFQDPKGTYPTSLIKQKSLFQLCAEKILAAGKQVERPLSLAIMTSLQNDQATQNYFKDAHFFGLAPEQVSFFTQGSLPLLDAQGELFLETPSQIAIGPNGNGFALKKFVESGLADQWQQKGIQYVCVVVIDNPLADPFDAELLGFHMRQGAEVTLKCTERKSVDERVGLLVKQNTHYRVIEYSEISETEKKALTSDGHLKHRCANLSLFCFSMDFIQRVGHQQHHFKLHPAWKVARYVDDQGQTHFPDKPNAWKFESFIFDVLNDTTKVAALLYPREQCFAPLKNFSGSDSLETVQDAIQKREQHIIKDLTGLPSPTLPFELAMDFYYPTSALKAKWKGKKISSGYIEP